VVLHPVPPLHYKSHFLFRIQVSNNIHILSLARFYHTQMAPSFFTLNTPDEYHNFDGASQRNKAPRPQKHVARRWQPYPIRKTQDDEPELPTTICPRDLYINKSFVPSAPKADYEMTSTFGAGGILGPQSMHMTNESASVAPSTDAPVMQAQLPTLPEEATHWPTFYSLKDLQATIMPQNPPAPSMVQSQMQATSNDQGYDQGLVHQTPYERAAGSSVQHTKRNVVDIDEVMRMRQQKQTRICPSDDPEFVSRCYLFCSRCPADSCFISNRSSRME
jgi:hypothetical protein